MILILDDDPARMRAFRRGLIGATLHTVSRADQAIDVITKTVPEVIFLDYDLDQHGDLTAGNGMQVVDAILMHPGRWLRTRFFVHSINPFNGPAMWNRLRSAGLNAHYVPLAWGRDAVLDLAIACSRSSAA
jgi:CheY-like chemotaxis protein